ncbi:cytochrome P450 [Mycena epipterygia]|nr:cytochrome P450 [Mycena epipterygia]
MSVSPLLNAGLACILYLVLRFYRTRKSLLPPGPRGLPLLGNLLDVPKTQEWLAFIEMSRKYDSDVISLNLMGDTVIVLNSLASVDDLLENKSAIYSDRYYFALPLHLFSSDYRKVFMRQFQPSEVGFHRPAELEAARVLLQRLLESPAKFERHLRHMAAMVILSTAYGIDVQSEDDPHITISEQALNAMACTGNRGAYLVDSLTFLKYVPEFLPGTGFKKEAREWRKIVSVMPEVPYNFVKKSLAEGTANSSIASRVLQEIEETGGGDDPESTLKNILAACYGASLKSSGADTTVSALGTFILAMTMYPEVQAKAQAAVDAVVGQGRLPNFDDSIPYVDAVLREVLRWRPVLPLGIPHAVTEDDIYKGYRIPARSVVVANSWAILHDEATYGPNTENFIPERWLTDDGKINTSMREPNAAWGFGRRVCPGKDMAQWSIWICATSILSTFNISKALGEKGIPIEPSGEYTSGLLCYPIPHKCDITPRSDAARAMIRTTVQN